MFNRSEVQKNILFFGLVKVHFNFRKKNYNKKRPYCKPIRHIGLRQIAKPFFWVFDWLSSSILNNLQNLHVPMSQHDVRAWHVYLDTVG